MMFEAEETRGRFAGLSSGAMFSWDIRGCFFCLGAVGLYWTNSIVTGDGGLWWELWWEQHRLELRVVS